MNALKNHRDARRGAALRFPLIAFACIAGAVFSLFAGCGLQTNGVPGEGGGGSGGGARTCNTVVDCDDNNPCTTDKCNGDGLCEHTKLDGVDTPNQKAGDCKTVKCVAGKEKSEPDDADINDDHESCTIDSCNAGVPSNTAKADKTGCDLMGSAGVCTNGKCLVSCKNDTECPSKGPCSTPTCNATMGVCTYPPLSDGTPTPGVTQKVGDCNINECVNGMPMDVPDDSDVPVTPTDCDLEACNNGMASNPAKAMDTPCNTFNGSAAGRCDGNATTPACRECATDVECHGPDPSDNCQARSCVNFACGPYPGNSTTAAAKFQMPGDCQKVVCDGNGGHLVVADAADPLDDNNNCTADACSGAGTTTNHTPANQGVQCGASASIVCNATGQCGCQTNADCTLPQTCGGGNPGTALVCGCTKKTCVQQGATCGTPSDGCGGTGTINCNDNVKNGGESDVDCGGTGQCQVKCANGKTCTQNPDCSSNNCVDGFCCDLPCNGLCQACSAAKKGSGVNGVCGAIKAGTDPDTECALQAVCAQNGFCDGTGACQLFASGTTCVANFCTGTVLSKTDTCNGGGTCVDAGTVDCSPYLCSGSMGSAACTTTCANDTGCAPAASTYCAGNACLARKVQGSVCGAAHECLSNFCIDGFCCDFACNSTCQSCAAATKQSGTMNGFCGQAKDGTDPHTTCPAGTMASCGNDGKCSGGACEKWSSSTVCAAATCSSGSQTTQKNCDGMGNCNVGGTTTPCFPYVCNGSTSCFTTCTMNSQCAANEFCIGNVCQKRPDGGVCSVDLDCVNGHCVGGMCCNTACPVDPMSTCGNDGTCSAGTCHKYTAGIVCAAASCANGTPGSQTTQKTCDGSGMCNVGGTVSSCGNYLCNGTVCNTSCTTNAQCVSGQFCISNVCQKKPNGTACGIDSDCANMHCVGNICCASACSDQGASMCHQDGACLANGSACEIYPMGTSCGSASCSAGVLQPASACDGIGAGMCVMPSTVTCSPYVCNGSSACLAACGTSDANCATGFYCDGVGAGVCQPKKVDGLTCTGTGNQCINGNCVDGFCCENACGGACEACNTTGNGGLCKPIAQLGTDSGCSAPNACDGARNCKLQNGQACTAGQCASGNCVDGFCCDTACTGACQACSAAKQGQGSNGTCGNIKQLLTDDAPVCSGANACDGTGLCKLQNGENCSVAGDCASGTCGTTPMKCQ